MDWGCTCGEAGEEEFCGPGEHGGNADGMNESLSSESLSMTKTTSSTELLTVSANSLITSQSSQYMSSVSGTGTGTGKVTSAPVATASASASANSNATVKLSGVRKGEKVDWGVVGLIGVVVVWIVGF